jgi:hypothetical protein
MTDEAGMRNQHPWAKWSRLRFIVVGLSVSAALLAAVALSGCGGTDAEAEQADAAVATEEREVEERERELEREEEKETEERQLENVGTITGEGEGTTVRNKFRLGPLLYSDEETPPEAALSSCLLSGSAAIASSVFAKGELQIEYLDGTLPIQIYLSNELVQAEGLQGTLAAQEIDGEWLCAIEDVYGVYYELEPGETQSIPFWVVAPGVLSNAQPKLPGSVEDAWYFDFVGPVGNQTELTFRGPGAVFCDEEFAEEWRLMLFNRAESSTCEAG